MLRLNLSFFSAKSPDPQRSVTTEFLYFPMAFPRSCTAYWGSIEGRFLRIHLEPHQRAVTFEFFHFTMEFLTFCTPYWGSRNFCKFTWAPTVSNLRIPSFSFALRTFCIPHWGSIHDVNPNGQWRPNSVIFIWNSLHFALNTEPQFEA